MSLHEQAIKDEWYGKHSPEKFRTWLVEKVIPALGPTTGKLYRDCARLCLQGDFDLVDRSLELAFYMDVVKQLDRCVA